jgi:quinol monooxygenase YgiN
VSIRVIVEIPAKPGKRAELMSLIQSIAGPHGPSWAGFLGATFYEVLDNPDIVIEVADWESVEARAAAMQQVMDSGAFAAMGDLLGGPFRATLTRQLA